MPKAPAWLKAVAQPKVAIPLVCVLAVVLLGVAGYLLIGDWLVAVVVALFLTLAALLVAFWRTVFARERADRLGRGIDDRDGGDAPAPAAGTAEARVHEAVARAVDDIRSSRIGEAGAAELPWLLVVGEPGSGKSALLGASGLDLPAKFAHGRGRGPTATCEWWLANQAVAIDTAGRYLLGDDEEAAREWRALLRLVRRQRSSVPINGIVLAVSATSLLSRSAGELEQLALATRRRLNEIEDTLHVGAPVYVVVTKCDAVEGFVETAGHLPGARLAEALGFTNDERELAHPRETVARGLAPLVARFETLVPGLVAREPDAARRRRLYAFPQELAAVADAVTDFVAAAFAPSSYDEMPFLRGVYLTSARREGTTLSPQLQRLGHAWAQHDVAGSFGEGGLFTRDLFSDEIVLGDEALALPLDSTSPRGRRLLHALAATVFVLLAAWWGVSFTENLGALRELSRTARLAAAGSSNVELLDELRAAIAGAEGERTVLQTGGLGANLDAGLARARTTFLWAFGREFEAPAKARLRGGVRGADDGAFEALASLAQDVAWLHAGAVASADAPEPRIAAYAPVATSGRDAFDRCYAAFAGWIAPEERKERARSESELVSETARELLDIERFNGWAERTKLYPAVTYAALGVPAGEDAPAVSGPYTRRGWEGIVSTLVRAVDATGSSTERVAAFRRAYVTGYDERWRRFLHATPMPPRAEANVKGSGYVRLVDAIHENTAVALPRDGAPPAWIDVVAAVHRTEPAGEEEAQAPWPGYLALLEQVGAEVASASENPALALDLARAMAQPGETSFRKALLAVRDLVPATGDAASAAKLRSILSMPVLDGASHVLASSLRGLEPAWRARIADRFDRGQLDTQGMLELYGRGGALAKFLDDDLGLFWGDQGAIPVIADRAVPFGADAAAWLDRAGTIVRMLETGARVPVVMEGIPATTTRGSIKVARRELRLTCSDPQPAFVYTEGGRRPHRFLWSPDCNALELRVVGLDANNDEVELRPRLRYAGPFAFPDFLNEARPVSRDRYRWRLDYPESGASIELEYVAQGAQTLRALQHRPPPSSLGSPPR